MSRVVAVVLNWCNEHDTAACVESLLLQTWPQTQVQAQDELKIVLVDNASPDGSGERLARRFPQLPFIQTGANLGYSGGNNAGIRWALEQGADWVLVLNNDTACEPSMVGELLAATARHPRAGALSPYIGLGDDPATPWFAGGRLDHMRALGAHERLEAESACTFLSGCCLMLRRSALNEVGAFDEAYWCYVEDLDLCIRLMRAKYELWYVPSARMVHRAPPVTAKPTAMQIEWRDRNRRRLARLHFPLMQRLTFSLWFFATRAALLARYALGGDVARARAVIAGAISQ
jgi:GT2 family glycosyltransferase